MVLFLAKQELGQRTSFMKIFSFSIMFFDFFYCFNCTTVNSSHPYHTPRDRLVYTIAVTMVHDLCTPTTCNAYSYIFNLRPLIKLARTSPAIYFHKITKKTGFYQFDILQSVENGILNLNKVDIYIYVLFVYVAFIEYAHGTKQELSVV